MNIWTDWGGVFNDSLMGLWSGFIGFAPKLILAIIFFIIGWVLAGLVAKALENVITALKLDRLFQSLGMDAMLMKMGMKLNSGYFIGEIVRWFIIIAFLVPSLSLMGLNEVSGFLSQDVLGFLPRVIVAALILVIATVVAGAVSKFVTAGAKALNLHSANMLGSIAKYAVWVFAFVIAFDKLGVFQYFGQILFGGLIAMLSIAFGLAFGLGGKDAAARVLDKVGRDSHPQQ